MWRVLGPDGRRRVAFPSPTSGPVACVCVSAASLPTRGPAEQHRERRAPYLWRLPKFRRPIHTAISINLVALTVIFVLFQETLFLLAVEVSFP
jgi:hypothetical protein